VSYTGSFVFNCISAHHFTVRALRVTSFRLKCPFFSPAAAPFFSSSIQIAIAVAEEPRPPPSPKRRPGHRRRRGAPATAVAEEPRPPPSPKRRPTTADQRSPERDPSCRLCRRYAPAPLPQLALCAIVAGEESSNRFIRAGDGSFFRRLRGGID
jgi:hypothetical protein